MIDFISFLNDENLLELLFSSFLFVSLIFFLFALSFRITSDSKISYRLISVSAFFLVLCLLLGAIYLSVRFGGPPEA